MPDKANTNIKYMLRITQKYVPSYLISSKDIGYIEVPDTILNQVSFYSSNQPEVWSLYLLEESNSCILKTLCIIISTAWVGIFVKYFPRTLKNCCRRKLNSPHNLSQSWCHISTRLCTCAECLQQNRATSDSFYGR